MTKPLLLLIAIALTSCSSQSDPPNKIEKKIRNPSFSVDSKSLYFDYCDGKSCNLAMYSLGDKTFTLLLPADKSLRFYSPGLGPKDEQLAAMVIERENSAQFTTQLVLIDLKSKSFRKLTDDKAIKYAPNFSYSGNTVAYAQSHRQRTSFNGTPRATGFELHTLNLSTGEGAQRTNFCFYGLSKPFFLPGSNDLVFSGEGPMCNYPESDTPAGSKGYLTYKERFDEDTIIRIGSSQLPLEPWFRNEGNSSNPSVAKNGDILFLSRTNRIDGIKSGNYNYDLFLRNEHTIRRLTQLKTIIVGNVLSPDSKYAAYISEPERNRDFSLWLLNIDKQLHEKILPAPSDGNELKEPRTIVLTEVAGP